MNKMNPSLIEEQVATLPELYADDLPRLLAAARDASLPKGITRIYALGNGDSYHAALSAAQAFNTWTDIRYIPMPAYTFWAKEMPRMKPEQKDETLVVCISASGSSTLAVDILNGAAQKGVAQTLSITGRPGSKMDQCAQWTISAAIREKGRSPGIRTYAASLCALLALAARLGKDQDRLDLLSRQIASAADSLPQVIDDSLTLASAAARADWPHAMVLSCDGLLGCAHFVAAKLAEGCGVLAVAQEMEEWCHVESMTYPLNAPVMILQGNDQTLTQTLKAAAVAKKAGRPIIIIGEKPSPELSAVADWYLPLDIGCADELSPLYYYIPGTLLSRALADKLDRAMFLSDLPINLF